MKIREKARTREQMFEGLKVGGAMSYSCGSDSYGYWIAEVDAEKNILGVYHPRTKFEHCWQDGTMIAEAFCPTTKPTQYFTAYRGKWYVIDPITKNRNYHEQLYPTEKPRFYRDPSF